VCSGFPPPQPCIIIPVVVLLCISCSWWNPCVCGGYMELEFPGGLWSGHHPTPVPVPHPCGACVCGVSNIVPCVPTLLDCYCVYVLTFICYYHVWVLDSYLMLMPGMWYYRYHGWNLLYCYPPCVSIHYGIDSMYVECIGWWWWCFLPSVYVSVW